MGSTGKDMRISVTGTRGTAAVTAFLVFVLACWLGLSMLPGPLEEHVQKSDGAIDLRDFDFKNGVQIIDGYENYDSWPQHLYTSQEFDRGIPGEPQILGWPDYRQVDKLQYATHSLTLLMPPGKIYAMSMKTAVYAQRLFINGEDMGSVGVPAANEEDFVPGTKDKTYYFTPLTERVEIIMHTANFVHSKNGCNPPDVIAVGSAENIDRRNRNSAFYNALITGGLIMSFLYHLSLFLVNRRRSLTLLFAVCSLLLALMDGKLFLAAFPNASWYMAFRFEYLVQTVTFASVLWFVYRQFSGLLHKAVVYAYSGCAVLYCFVIMAGTRLFTGTAVFIEYISAGVILYLIMRFAMSLREGKLSNILGFAGVLVLGLFTVNDIFEFRLATRIFSLPGQLYTAPVGMVFFVFCYALLIAVEYAETQRNEQKLTLENASLERLNRLKTDLMTTISHEARTPLAVLASYAGIVSIGLRQKGVDEQTAADLDKIVYEAKRVANLIDRMKEVTVNAPESPERPEHIRFDMGDLISQTAGLYRPVLERAGVRLEVSIAGELPVSGRPEELTQVMFNILDNAKKYTEQGGVAVTAEKRTGVVMLTVSDTGTGVAPELLPRIFERGVKGDEPGTGIGLSICKEIIEAHGGTITAKNKETGGTEVTVSLPLQ